MAPKGKTTEDELGQFIFINFENRELREEINQFSIPLAAYASNLEIVVKFLGDFTAKLGNLKIGDMARFKGLSENFPIKKPRIKSRFGLAVASVLRLF